MAPEFAAPVDFKFLFEKSPGFYLILDRDLRVVGATDAYCRAVRNTRENLLGLKVAQLFPDRQSNPGAGGFDRLQESLDRVLRLKRPDTMAIQRYDIPRSRREGGGFVEKHWSPRNIPILDESGEVRWIVHRVHDVTTEILDPEADESRRQFAHSQTRMIRELQSNNEELAQLDGLRAGLLQMSRLSTVATMSSALAHDVSQPLPAAKNYLGALRRGRANGVFDDAKAEELLDKIGAQIDRAGAIVRDLRSFMASGSASRRAESVSVVVADAVRLGEAALRTADARLIVHVDPELPPVDMDRVQIQQVIVNLLANAADAVRGRSRREVTVRAALSDDALEIEVADTGIGLAPDVAERLFAPFASTQMIGLGLGLPICSQIVAEHKGVIGYRPNRPEGAIFRFTVACDRARTMQPS